MRLPLTCLTASFLIAIVSCEDESALDRLGDGCLLNSDCEAGLVCVFERCHIACNSSIDCPLASDGTQLRCVLGEKPSHVCQLETERDCAYHSECPGSQICGPDGQCRDECLDDRDCVGGQICVAEGVCADEAELADGVLPNRTPPEGQNTGFPCAYDSQCLEVSPPEGPVFVCKNGGCNYACYDTIDCDASFVCTPDDGDPATPGECLPGPSTINCVPGEQKACDCWPPESGTGVQVCAPDGQGFLPCQSDANPDCGLVP